MRHPASPTWHGFRELDQALGLPKGSAFRTFKAIRQQLQEGSDFRVVPHGRETELIQSLRQAGRIYESSINVVLLSAETKQQLESVMRGSSEPHG